MSDKEFQHSGSSLCSLPKLRYFPCHLHCRNFVSSVTCGGQGGFHKERLGPTSVRYSPLVSFKKEWGIFRCMMAKERCKPVVILARYLAARNA